MLFETLKQSYIFLGVVYFGILAGILKDIISFIQTLFNNKKLINFILDLIFSIGAIFLLITCLNVVNYGEFRFYLLISFIIGYVLERISIGFLVDFILKKLYNLTIKIVNKLSKTKFFKRILGIDKRTSTKINKDR